ncbi:MAG: MBL fold metallo-hydrolase [Chloroflexota bacterium]
MIQHIKDDLYQIGEHVKNEYGFEAILTYVMLNDGNPILVDCGSHIHRDSVMAQLNELLDGATPEYLLLTHSELPHAGNIAAVAEKWPNIKVIVSNVMLPYIEVLPVLPLEQITQVVPGTKYEFPTRTVEFVDALLKDQPGSHWIHDTRSGALFTGDGFGYFNGPDAIDQLPRSAARGVTETEFAQYHKVAFRFLRWIRPERLAVDLRKMFDKRNVQVIAPIHGNAICGDIQTHLDRLIAALTAVKLSYQ